MKSIYSNKKDLLIELVRTNFKLRYNNSLLGFVWVLLKPLLTFLVLYFVFSRFRAEWIDNYQIYLLLGIILYTFFNEGIMFGMSSILSTSHIILKVNFPREVALSSSIIMALINFIINIIVLGIFMIFNPISTSVIGLLYFILIICALFLVIYAVSLFSSIILVKLRDLEHITTLILQLLFYATPIFYPIDILPVSAQRIIGLNPLTIIIQASRSAVITGEVVLFDRILIVIGGSILFIFLGKLFFNKNIKRIAELF